MLTHKRLKEAAGTQAYILALQKRNKVAGGNMHQ